MLSLAKNKNFWFCKNVSQSVPFLYFEFYFSPSTLHLIVMKNSNMKVLGYMRSLDLVDELCHRNLTCHVGVELWLTQVGAIDIDWVKLENIIWAKNIWSKKSLFKKEFCLKTFGKKHFDSKIFFNQKIWIPKNFVYKKSLSKKILRPKNVAPKQIRFKKIFGQTKIWFERICQTNLFHKKCW